MTKCLNEKLGLTLLEVIVAIAIILLVLGLMIFSLANFRRTQLLSGTTEQLIGLLNEARSRTISAVDGAQHGVHLTSNRAQLFQGAAYSGGTIKQTLDLDSALTLTWFLGGSAGVSDIIFQKLTGKTGQYGTTTLSLTFDSSKNRVISIESTGLVQLKSQAN